MTFGTNRRGYSWAARFLCAVLHTRLRRDLHRLVIEMPEQLPALHLLLLLEPWTLSRSERRQWRCRSCTLWTARTRSTAVGHGLYMRLVAECPTEISRSWCGEQRKQQTDSPHVDSDHSINVTVNSDSVWFLRESRTRGKKRSKLISSKFRVPNQNFDLCRHAPLFKDSKFFSGTQFGAFLACENVKTMQLFILPYKKPLRKKRGYARSPGFKARF